MQQQQNGVNCAQKATAKPRASLGQQGAVRVEPTETEARPKGRRGAVKPRRVTLGQNVTSILGVAPRNPGVSPGILTPDYWLSLLGCGFPARGDVSVDGVDSAELPASGEPTVLCEDDPPMAGLTWASVFGGSESPEFSDTVAYELLFVLFFSVIAFARGFQGLDLVVGAILVSVWQVFIDREPVKVPKERLSQRIVNEVESGTVDPFVAVFAWPVVCLATAISILNWLSESVLGEPILEPAGGKSGSFWARSKRARTSARDYGLVRQRVVFERATTFSVSVRNGVIVVRSPDPDYIRWLMYHRVPPGQLGYRLVEHLRRLERFVMNSNWVTDFWLRPNEFAKRHSLDNDKYIVDSATKATRPLVGVSGAVPSIDVYELSLPAQSVWGAVAAMVGVRVTSTVWHWKANGSLIGCEHGTRGMPIHFGGKLLRPSYVSQSDDLVVYGNPDVKWHKPKVGSQVVIPSARGVLIGTVVKVDGRVLVNAEMVDGASGSPMLDFDTGLPIGVYGSGWARKDGTADYELAKPPSPKYDWSTHVERVEEDDWYDLVAPVGAGKSTYFIEALARRFERIKLVQPRIINVKQIYDRLVSAGLNVSARADESRFLRGNFATSQVHVVTAGSAAFESEEGFDVLVLDESHETEPFYDLVRELYLSGEMGCKVVTMTATPEGYVFEPSSQPTRYPVQTSISKRLTVSGSTLAFFPTVAACEKAVKDVKHRNGFVWTRETTSTVVPRIVKLLESGSEVFVAATNVAETGITLPFDTVYDSGLTNEVRYEREGPTQSIRRSTPAESAQRLGRVGRTKPGSYVCAPGAGTGVANRRDYAFDCELDLLRARRGRPSSPEAVALSALSPAKVRALGVRVPLLFLNMRDGKLPYTMPELTGTHDVDVQWTLRDATPLEVHRKFVKNRHVQFVGLNLLNLAIVGAQSVGCTVRLVGEASDLIREACAVETLDELNKYAPYCVHFHPVEGATLSDTAQNADWGVLRPFVAERYGETVARLLDEMSPERRGQAVDDLLSESDVSAFWRFYGKVVGLHSTVSAWLTQPWRRPDWFTAYGEELLAWLRSEGYDTLADRLEAGEQLDVQSLVGTKFTEFLVSVGRETRTLLASMAEVWSRYAFKTPTRDPGQPDVCPRYSYAEEHRWFTPERIDDCTGTGVCAAPMDEYVRRIETWVLRHFPEANKWEMDCLVRSIASTHNPLHSEDVVYNARECFNGMSRAHDAVRRWLKPGRKAGKSERELIASMLAVDPADTNLDRWMEPEDWLNVPGPGWEETVFESNRYTGAEYAEYTSGEDTLSCLRRFGTDHYTCVGRTVVRSANEVCQSANVVEYEVHAVVNSYDPAIRRHFTGKRQVDDCTQEHHYGHAYVKGAARSWWNAMSAFTVGFAIGQSYWMSALTLFMYAVSWWSVYAVFPIPNGAAARVRASATWNLYGIVFGLFVRSTVPSTITVTNERLKTSARVKNARAHRTYALMLILAVIALPFVAALPEIRELVSEVSALRRTIGMGQAVYASLFSAAAQFLRSGQLVVQAPEVDYRDVLLNPWGLHPLVVEVVLGLCPVIVRIAHQSYRDANVESRAHATDLHLPGKSKKNSTEGSAIVGLVGLGAYHALKSSYLDDFFVRYVWTMRDTENAVRGSRVRDAAAFNEIPEVRPRGPEMVSVVVRAVRWVVSPAAALTTHVSLMLLQRYDEQLACHMHLVVTANPLGSWWHPVQAAVVGGVTSILEDVSVEAFVLLTCVTMAPLVFNSAYVKFNRQRPGMLSPRLFDVLRSRQADLLHRFTMVTASGETVKHNFVWDDSPIVEPSLAARLRARAYVPTGGATVWTPSAKRAQVLSAQGASAGVYYDMPTGLFCVWLPRAKDNYAKGAHVRRGVRDSFKDHAALLALLPHGVDARLASLAERGYLGNALNRDRLGLALDYRAAKLAEMLERAEQYECLSGLVASVRQYLPVTLAGTELALSRLRLLGPVEDTAEDGATLLVVGRVKGKAGRKSRATYNRWATAELDARGYKRYLEWGFTGNARDIGEASLFKRADKEPPDKDPAFIADLCSATRVLRKYLVVGSEVFRGPENPKATLGIAERLIEPYGSIGEMWKACEPEIRAQASRFHEVVYPELINYSYKVEKRHGEGPAIEDHSARTISAPDARNRLIHMCSIGTLLKATYQLPGSGVGLTPFKTSSLIAAYFRRHGAAMSRDTRHWDGWNTFATTAATLGILFEDDRRVHRLLAESFYEVGVSTSGLLLVHNESVKSGRAQTTAGNTLLNTAISMVELSRASGLSHDSVLKSFDMLTAGDDQVVFAPRKVLERCAVLKVYDRNGFPQKERPDGRAYEVQLRLSEVTFCSNSVISVMTDAGLVWAPIRPISEITGKLALTRHPGDADKQAREYAEVLCSYCLMYWHVGMLRDMYHRYDYQGYVRARLKYGPSSTDFHFPYDRLPAVVARLWSHEYDLDIGYVAPLNQEELGEFWDI